MRFCSLLGVVTMALALSACMESDRTYIRGKKGYVEGNKKENNPVTKAEAELLNSRVHAIMALLELTKMNEILDLSLAQGEVDPCQTFIDDERSLFHHKFRLQFQQGCKVKKASLVGSESYAVTFNSGNDIESIDFSSRNFQIQFKNRKGRLIVVTMDREFKLRPTPDKNRFALTMKTSLNTIGESPRKNLNQYRTWDLETQAVLTTPFDFTAFDQSSVQVHYALTNETKEESKRTLAQLKLVSKGPNSFNECGFPTGQWQAEYANSTVTKLAPGVVSSTATHLELPWITETKKWNRCHKVRWPLWQQWVDSLTLLDPEETSHIGK